MKLAVVIGHNKLQQGFDAIAPLSISEYELHQRVADVMIARNQREDLTIQRFFRQSGTGYHQEILNAYAKVNAWGPDYCMELHFNSTPGASGTEVLYSGSAKSRPFAAAVLSALVAAFQLPDRGLKERGKNERGAGSIWACKCPCILTEPFFGDSKKDVAAYMRLDVAGYADALLAGIPGA